MMGLTESEKLALVGRIALWRSKARRRHGAAAAAFENAADQAESALKTGWWPLFAYPLLQSFRLSLARSERLAAARSRGTHTDAEWDSLLCFCGGVCVRCGSDQNVQKDHIVPLFMPSASDAIENLQPLCGSCNSGKGHDCTDYRPDGWRETVEWEAPQ